MKEFRGEAGTGVDASAGQCLTLLLDIEGYPSWYPEVIRRAEVVRPASDDAPPLAQTTVHLGVGPVRRDFELLLALTSEDGPLVRLTRVGHHAADPEELSLTWRIEDHLPPSGTRLTVAVSARLEVPRLLPLQGLGDVVAKGFVSAAAQALERR